MKSAAEGGERGFHRGKRIKGRPRHAAVDSQGSLLALRVTAVSRSDSAEAGAVMTQALENDPYLESFTADQGYKAQAAEAAVRLDCELVVAKKKEGLGFTVIAFRWIVGRTFAWLMQCRLLIRDYAKSIASAEAWIWCAMFRLLARRLAPAAS